MYNFYTCVGFYRAMECSLRLEPTFLEIPTKYRKRFASTTVIGEKPKKAVAGIAVAVDAYNDYFAAVAFVATESAILTWVQQLLLAGRFGEATEDVSFACRLVEATEGAVAFALAP